MRETIPQPIKQGITRFEQLSVDKDERQCMAKSVEHLISGSWRDVGEQLELNAEILACCHVRAGVSPARFYLSPGFVYASSHSA